MSFPFEALTWIDNNTSKWHVILHCPHPCVSSCIWTIHQATNGSTSKFHLGVLHHHTFSSMLSDGKSQAHCVQILSCSRLEASVWFITQLIFSTFWLFSLIFSKTLRTWLGLPHPSIANILQCVCTHPIDLMGIHFLCYVHGKECIGTHDVIRDTFVTIAWNASFSHGMKTITCASFNHIQLLSLMTRHYAHQRW